MWMRATNPKGKTMDRIEALVLDGGRILFDFDKPSACELIARASSYDATAISQIIATQLEKPLECGQMSETAFCNELMHHCKTEGLTVPDVQRIWGNIISPNPVIDPYIEALMAKGMKIGVLSNTNSIHWPYIMDVPIMGKLKKYGATFSLSYQVGASKPDRRIFDHALRALDVKPSQALYVDDIRDYVLAARKLGMQTEQYDCSQDPPSRLDEIFKEKYRLL